MMVGAALCLSLIVGGAGLAAAAAGAAGRNGPGALEQLRQGVSATIAAPATPQQQGADVSGSAASAAIATAQATAADVATGALRYIPGYSLQNGWLCYGWRTASGYVYWRCTQRWVQRGDFDVPTSSFVPLVGGGLRVVGAPTGLNGGSGSAKPTSAPTTGGSSGGGSALSTFISALPAALKSGNLWAFTGRFAFTEWRGGQQGYPYGQCTAGAAQLAGYNVTALGNAKDWLANARRRGMATGYTPRVGATVVYQPGADDASYLGHVAHVVAVYPLGFFMVEEVNYGWNGGGWGRFSFRFSHVGSGVAFIYG